MYFMDNLISSLIAGAFGVILGAIISPITQFFSSIFYEPKYYVDLKWGVDEYPSFESTDVFLEVQNIGRTSSTDLCARVHPLIMENSSEYYSSTIELMFGSIHPNYSMKEAIAKMVYREQQDSNYKPGTVYFHGPINQSLGFPDHGFTVDKYPFRIVIDLFDENYDSWSFHFELRSVTEIVLLGYHRRNQTKKFKRIAKKR